MGSANAARDFGFGTSANRPDASDVQVGYRYFSEDTGAMETVVSDGGVRSWVGASTPAADLIVYASPTGTGSGRSIDDPTNIVDGLDMFAGGFTGIGELRLLSGTYTMPQTLAFPPPASGANNANGFLMRGVDTEQWTLGVRTLTGYAAGTIPFGSVLTDSGLALAANAYRGWWVRWLTGAAAGTRKVIANSGTTTLTFASAVSSGALPGDTYVVERPAAELRIVGSAFRNLSFQGNTLFAVYGVRITSSVSGLVSLNNSICLMDFCSFEGSGLNGTEIGACLYVISLNNPINLGQRRYPSYVDPEFTSTAGCAFINTADPNFSFRSFGGSIFRITGSMYYNSRISIGEEGYGYLSTCSMELTIARAITGGHLNLSGCRFSGVGPGPLGVLSAWNGSKLYASAVDISNNDQPNIPGVWVNEFSYASIAAITGSNNTGAGSVGVMATAFSRVQVSDPNTGTTITGPAGDVKVGTVVAAKTWLQIAGNVTADVSDPATFVRVSAS